MVSTTEKILEFLATPKGRSYKGVQTNAVGIPIFLFEIFTPNAVQAAMSRLKKRKYVTFSGSTITITKEGERYHKKRSARMQMFDSSFSEASPKNLLLIFDIPEKRKAEREWLRRQLRAFNYMMIQQSVWVGPSPLPKEFKEYLKKVDLENCLKYFKLAKGYPIAKEGK